MRENWMPAFESNCVPIVLSTSNLYAPYAGVLIQSIINHANLQNNYDIIICEKEISAENKRLIQLMAEKKENISVRFLDLLGLAGGLHYDSFAKHWPLEVFGGIFSAFYLLCYSKIIFLNTDMLLNEDVALLINESDDNKCIAAVKDIIVSGGYNSNYSFSVMNGEITKDYFQKVLSDIDINDYINSGTVLFNCEKIRSTIAVDTLFSVCANPKMVFPDQDALNLLFKNDIHFLNSKWNYLVSVNANFEKLFMAAPSDIRKNHEDAYRRGPALLHWAGKPKPWICPDVPFGNQWWQAAMQTPFIGHIIARMIDGLQERNEYYLHRYGKKVPAWDPAPSNVKHQVNGRS